MRPLILIGVAVLVTACGETVSGQDTAIGPAASPPASKPGPPTTPKPPLAGLSDGPPPAWLETEGGSFWLGYSSYCWGTLCADFIPPSCEDAKHTPKITLARGEIVTAQLAFEPTELGLSYLAEEGAPTAEDQKEFVPSSTPSWRVERDGSFSLFARGKAGGATYVACVVLG